MSVERGRPFEQTIPVKRENVESTVSQIDMENLELTVKQINENPEYYKPMAKEQNK